MRRLFADLQRAAGGNSVGIGLTGDLGMTPQDGERVILFDDELEIQATLHHKEIQGPRGHEAYWIADLDPQTKRHIA